MKTIFKICTVAILVMVLLTAFTGCEIIEQVKNQFFPQQPAVCEHVWQPATCTTHETCSLCGAVNEETPLGAHVEVVDEAVEATCTTDGKTAGKHCSVCNETIVAQETIPAGHTLTDVAEQAATCTEAGYSAHQACSKCDYTEGKTEIPALEHDMQEVEGKEATCTEAGYSAHQKCSRCDHVDGKTEIPAGHTLKDVAEQAATCTEAGYSAHKACTKCDYVEGKTEILASHTPGAEADCTTAQTCTVCGTELVAKLGHVDANLDIECDREGCTSKVAPAADTVLSNFTANNLGSKLATSGSYYVVGTIVEVLDARNGIFYLDDGTGEKFYFRLPKNADGVSHSDWEIKLVVGDKVQVYGKINKYSSTSAPNGQYWPAIQSGVVTVLEQHPHDFTFKPAGCSDPAYCACGQSQGEPLGCADKDGDNLCDDCGKNVNYKYEYVEIRTDNESGVIDTTAGTYTWGNDNFSVYVSKGTSSQLYSTAKDHMRIYKGNNLVLVNKNGLKVKTITIYATNATQAANLVKFLSGYTCTTDEEKFTVTFEVSELTTLTLTDSTGTIQIKGVEFGYEKPKAEPVTVVMANTITDTQSTNMTGGNDAALLGLDPSIFSVIGSKGSCSSSPFLYYKSTLTVPSQMRLYNHTSADGNSITVSVAEGYEIVSIKITFAITGRANGYVITNAEGTEIANVATDATIDNEVVEYDVNSGSFTFKNVHTISNKQIWIGSIEITYQPK